MKNILCYGDSNTWGYMPAKGTRYPREIRWPGVAAAVLGDEYNLIEDSISGRTSGYDDPFLEARNGLKNLGYSLQAHAPLDMVIVAVGTNDLKYTDAFGSARGVGRIIDNIRNGDIKYDSVSPMYPNGVKILLISPPELHENIELTRPEHPLSSRVKESKRFSENYRMIARLKNVEFIDAAEYVKGEPADGIHLSPESHEILGKVIAAKIREMLE